ncbi:hypothetical protein [Methylophilus aquaticus]|uniref:Uncharacterized protein n=1 Tax=Methylophilus aquaticus TaxID=1971610 RepID=A0ABT9JU24_9PROT|nr:hypothetical protein [Methylophilus aquaticus]MDP8567610.1 hypothetical protein [Methylophilus aquaticus]
MTHKKSILILSTIFCFCTQTVYAEQWQTVSGKEKFLAVSVDLESIQPGYHEDIVFFRLRSDDHYDTVSTRTVQASCSELSIEVDQEVVLNKAEQTVEKFDWKNPTLKSIPTYAHSRLSFWGYTQAFGNAIKLACNRIGNHAPQRLEAMEQEQCSLANPLYKVACAPYASWRANYKLYLSRSHDAIYNCGISEDRMAKQTGLLLKNVMRCQSESCGNQILENWIQKRGQDIATVIHLPNQQQQQIWVAPVENQHLCSSLDEADQEIARIDSEEMFAKAKYMGCLKREGYPYHSTHKDQAPALSLNKKQNAETACAQYYQQWQHIISEKAAFQKEIETPETEAEFILFSNASATDDEQAIDVQSKH